MTETSAPAPPCRAASALPRAGLLAWGRWLALSALLLAGCAAVPTIPQPALQNTAVIQPIRMRGPRGSLSRRETAVILRRLNAQVPDAGAFDRHLAVEQYVAGTPLYTGNRVLILRDGPETFAAMFRAIRAAQHYLYLEYYIFEDVSEDGQQLSDLLIQRHRAGVHIDIIYDAIGSLSTPVALFQRLRDAGINVLAYNPIATSLFSINDRDHRKILIADGSTAIIGGVNLSTDYQSSAQPGSAPGTSGSGSDPPARASSHADSDPPSPKTPPAPAPAAAEPWHDMDIQIDGPAVIELRKLFEQHWRDQGGNVAQLADSPDMPQPQGNQVVRIIGSEGGQTLPRYYATLLSAIRTATSRIWVEAAYFVPTYQERQALGRAARRGVDVRLLLPSRSDSPAALAVQHSYYGGLLRAGVKIYERDDGILHSKVAVMDGVWSIVGSSNFDHRSVLFNDEVDAVVIGDRTGLALEQYFQQDLQHARRITLAQWRHRPFGTKLHEQFWRLWQQLL